MSKSGALRTRNGNKHSRASTRREHWLDIWLPRISHFSQLGLLLLTVGGLYFTVIPLYQKALLDEAIARKEIELDQTQGALDRAYISVRKIAVHQFVALAIDKCSRTPRLQLSSEESPSRPQPWPKRAADAPLFKTEAKGCISEAVKGMGSLGELRPADKEIFLQETERIVGSLASLQNEAITAFDYVPIKAKSNPNAFELKSDARSRALEFTAKYRIQNKNKIQMLRSELAATQAQEAIEAKYHESLLREITSVRELKWPSNKPSSR